MRQLGKQVIGILLCLVMIVGMIQVTSVQAASKKTVFNNYTTQDGLVKKSKFILAENTKAVKPYLDAAKKRKKQILNSKTEIVKSDKFIPGKTYTGTAYYVSSIRGDDNNDGLTPETPKTIASICNWSEINENLTYGDAIFFERGSVFRLENVDSLFGNSTDCITLKSGVTYSAYGNGDKPVFTKAIENSAYEDAWELYYTGKSGQKIWRYHQKVQYCMGIIFDEKSYAKRIFEWPTPKGWLAVKETEINPSIEPENAQYTTLNTKLESKGKYLSVEESLNKDLTYLTRLDLEGCKYPLDFAPGVDEEACERTGKPFKSYNGDLYLRCDKGNPGKLYKDIEIIAVAPDTNDLTFDGYHADDFVLDNLCTKFTHIPVGGNTARGNAVIQNCAFEWEGTRLHRIESAKPTCGYSLIGDGIYGIAKNATIKNNYCYQMAEGVTFESQATDSAKMGNCIITGNLIEYCGEGVRINWTKKNAFDTIKITDNMILNCGYGFNNNDFEGYFSIDIGWDNFSFAKKMIIKDNVCLKSKFGLLMMPGNSKAKITSNVFIQPKKKALMIKNKGFWGTWTMMGKELLGKS